MHVLLDCVVTVVRRLVLGNIHLNVTQQRPWVVFLRLGRLRGWQFSSSFLQCDLFFDAAILSCCLLHPVETASLTRRLRRLTGRTKLPKLSSARPHLCAAANLSQLDVSSFFGLRKGPEGRRKAQRVPLSLDKGGERGDAVTDEMVGPAQYDEVQVWIVTVEFLELNGCLFEMAPQL